MGYYAGRFLQIIGLIALPVGVLISIQYDTLKPELYYGGVGLCLFVLGSMLVSKFGKNQ